MPSFFSSLPSPSHIVVCHVAFFPPHQFNSLINAAKKQTKSDKRRTEPPFVLSSRLLFCCLQSFTGSALAALVKGLPEALQRQYEYEDPIVRGGKQLLHSPFFKVRPMLFFFSPPPTEVHSSRSPSCKTCRLCLSGPSCSRLRSGARHAALLRRDAQVGVVPPLLHRFQSGCGSGQEDLAAQALPG